MNEKYIGDRLAEILHERKIPDAEFSRDVFMNEGYINRITNGSSLPSISKFLTICDELKITPAQFYFKELDKYSIEMVKLMFQMDNTDKEYILKMARFLLDDKKKSGT